MFLGQQNGLMDKFACQANEGEWTFRPLYSGD